MIDYQAIPLKNTSAKAILEQLMALAQQDGYTVEDVDLAKPWGGYVRFANTNAPAFINQFFPEITVSTHGQLSPKFLVAAPHQRLSWQRHQRRSEIWKFLSGGGGVAQSMDPSKQPVKEMSDGEVAVLDQGESHRLISLEDKFVLVAEIWQHTDPAYPSDEQDIERLEDDYNR